VPNPGDLRLGRIIWAVVRDHNGVPKKRPGVICTKTADIVAGKPFIVMAITTTYGDPPAKNLLELPLSPLPGGHPITKLKRRSAAVLDWLDGVTPEDVLECQGEVPKKLMINHILPAVGG
jgi:hypothetical protein